MDEEDIAAVAAVLRADFLTCGPKVEEFEKSMAETLGCGHCIAVANGTAALHIALLALGVEPGEAGLTSPLTFLASANALAYAGARPDFVDIDAFRCLSVEALEARLRSGPPPRVVIPVDFAGIPADLPALHALSRRFGFRVVEDAAHSLGSSYAYRDAEGTPRRAFCGSCTHSDLAILSFHPVKTLTTGEGGMICTHDAGLAAACRRLASHGLVRDPSLWRGPDRPREPGPGNAWYYEMQELGFNYRLTDLQSALGLSQLRKLPFFKKRRMDLAARYREGLEDLEQEGLLRLPAWRDGDDPCLHLYAVEFTGAFAARRDEVFGRLREAGILCQVHYHPVHLQPWYRERFGYGPGKCPAAEAYARASLSLPLFPALADADVERVLRELRKILKGD